MDNYIYYVFIISFLINVIIMPLITTASYDQITFNMIKVISSIILGLLIVISHISMVYFIHGTINMTELLIYIIILCIYINVYRNQLFIDETNYLNHMKEVNLNEILISSKIIKNPVNENVLDYANFILANSIKENNYINAFLDNKKN